MLETVEEARHFRDQTNRFALIYEVGILEESKPIHRGDYYKCSPQGNESFLDQMETVALAYWQSSNIQHPEVVSESAIEILALVS